MKLPGARWKEDSGQRVLALRSLVLSDRWEPAMRLTMAPCAPKSGSLPDQDQNQTPLYHLGGIELFTLHL